MTVDLIAKDSPTNYLSNHDDDWIRGVNIGGWLVLERYISPFQFALTECHIRGDLCWFPGQLGAPLEGPWCDPRCRPLRWNKFLPDLDYPIDEATLAAAFHNHTDAERWFNVHFDNFLKKEDLRKAKEAGITHLRVPLPHWILGTMTQEEHFVVGDRWAYFERMLEWAREFGLQVWPNVHTAPGSQNNFDNSGKMRPHVLPTCDGWQLTADHVQRSVDAIHQITRKIVEQGFTDVVTGFGLLNEPFFDCHVNLYRHFLDDGLTTVRRNMGPHVKVYVSDLFDAELFNNGTWWLDSKKYQNTLLDSHYYHVFKQAFRAMSPKQHIAYTCLPQPDKDGFDACCWEDAPHNTVPSQGVQRIVTEFSAAFDQNPGDYLEVIMDRIASSGTAPKFNRTLSHERKQFLMNFAQAQMVSYEARELQLGKGWFYWTLKLEGKAFAEWDFLKAYYEDKWFPRIAPRNVSSEEMYGSCHDILLRTDDDISILDQFPVFSNNTDDEIIFDDDLVVTHGQSLQVKRNSMAPTSSAEGVSGSLWAPSFLLEVLAVMCLPLIMFIGYRVWHRHYRRSHYTKIEQIPELSV